MSFINDESGATSIEYTIIMALIGGATVVGLTQLGTWLDNQFFTATSAFSSLG